MKIAIHLFPVILFGNMCFAQDYSVAIKTDADKMNIAFLTGDVNTILAYTYPAVFEVVGDRDLMAELITNYLMEMQERGYHLDTATISSPGVVVVAGTELHCFITQTIYSTFSGGTLKNDVPLLAVSSDGGVHWYFVDMRRVTPDLLRFMFPQYNQSLSIPELPPPVVIYSNGIGEGE